MRSLCVYGQNSAWQGSKELMSVTQDPLVSIVVPVLNEHESVVELVNDIAEAMGAAGMEVELIMDRQNSRIKSSVRPSLRRAGITVYTAPEGMRMHNKVILIDDSLVITGSFNLTWSADRKNVENLLILRGRPRITEAYLRQHKWLRKRSKKYATKKD